MIAALASQFSGFAVSAARSTSAARTNDRAQGGSHAAPTLLVASGRGGSGTTLLCALLSVAAAGDGYRVVLVDGDDLVGPLATVLGVHAHAGWQDLRGGRATLADVATPVSTTLTLVAGGAPRVGAAESVPASSAERRACMRRLSTITDGADLVVIDCGSRLDSVLAAVTPHANERLVAVAAGSDPISLASTFALCKAVHARHAELPLEVLVNRHDASTAVPLFDAIDAGARAFLGTALRLAGAVPNDSTLDAALRAGIAFPDAAAGSPAAVAAHDAVTRVIAAASQLSPGA